MLVLVSGRYGSGLVARSLHICLHVTVLQNPHWPLGDALFPGDRTDAMMTDNAALDWVSCCALHLTLFTALSVYQVDNAILFQ